MKLTKHAKRRMKARVSNHNVQSILKNVRRFGLEQKDFSGNLRSYLDAIAIKHKRTPVVYKGNVYCMAGGGTVITVFPLPPYLVEEYKIFMNEWEKTDRGKSQLQSRAAQQRKRQRAVRTTPRDNTADGTVGRHSSDSWECYTDRETVLGKSDTVPGPRKSNSTNRKNHSRCHQPRPLQEG